MSKRRRTILWAEDDYFALSDYKTLLEDKGFDVLRAHSLTESKNVIESNHGNIDLVIVDIRMPVGGEIEINQNEYNQAKGGYESGLTLARWIRKHYPRLPIVAFSAFADEQARQWFENYGVGNRPKSEIFESVDELTNWIESAINPRRKSKQRIKTFIVHGRDESSKYELKNYIQNTLRLGEPLILHEQPSLGRTIIEKFEEEVRDVNLVFVLLTPDDYVYDEQTPNDIKRRARQNVIFEMGYLFAKLDRRKGQVLLLYKAPLELPSDISGLIYIDITNGVEAAGENIRRELQGII